MGLGIRPQDLDTGHEVLLCAPTSVTLPFSEVQMLCEGDGGAFENGSWFEKSN